VNPIDATLFAKATYALRASDGPTLSRSSLTLIYPASLSEVIKMESAFVAAHESAYGQIVLQKSAVIEARLLPRSLGTVLTIRSLRSGDAGSNGTDT
jgi:hypothetical protein